MRTTIDIPDELFREIKAMAAKRGQKLKDLVIDALQAATGIQRASPKKRVLFPIVNSARPGHMTAEMVKLADEQAQEAEDLRRAFPM